MKTRLKTNYLITLILLFLFAFMAVGIFLQSTTEKAINKSREGNIQALRSSHIQNEIQNILTDVVIIENKVRSLLITGDSTFINGIRSDMERLKRDVINLQRIALTAGNASAFNLLVSLSDRKVDFCNQLITAFYREGTSAASQLIATDEGTILRDSIILVAKQVEKEFRDTMTATLNQNNERSGSVLFLSRVLSFISVGATLILCLIVVRHLEQQHSFIKQLEVAHAGETEARQKVEKISVEVQEARRIAEESAKVKEQFLANMSHEIRTPVNSVIGFTNLLQKTPLSAEQQQFVTLVQSASENLLSIINDILDISKIEAGMLRIEKSQFSLRGLCNSIATMFYHRAQEKNLSFAIHIHDSIPDTLTGDAVRLTQILVNLISNAVKFTQEGSIVVTISPVSQTDHSVYLLFSVKDTGIGIAHDKLETIFERFEQGETDITRKYGGTGLGLAIVKKLVELQHGQTGVSSEPGKGTEFYFKIEYELLPATLQAGITDAGPTGVDTGSFKNIRILVAEDNHMNQLLIKYTFENWKVPYELAENGEQVLDWLQREPFDLLLLDIQMPVMNGYITAQNIRKELKSSIPIIAMTAHAMPGEREKCLSHGMNDYIPKPIHERELHTLIKKHLNNHTESMESLKSSLQYIDLDFLYDLVMGNTEFLQNVIRQFLKQFPGEMELLKEAVANKDLKQVSTLTHHIQSTVSVLGKNTQFFRQLEKMEKMSHNKANAPRLAGEMKQLLEYQQYLMQEINRLLKTSL
jgi:signal transduction histidine kinase/DNA-binding response OmpR family regulator